MRDPVVRGLWVAAGFVALGIGIAGIVLPLLPGVLFVILAAWCFSRGSRRWERWMLEHKYLGPMVRDWRENHSVPLRAKQIAIATMAISCAGAWYFLPAKLDWFPVPVRAAWIPTVICAVAAIWMLRLPTRRRAESPEPPNS